jgi:hypothetical protein
MKETARGAVMVMRTARMMPQLETGPQKWVVLGPTGLFRNALNAADMAGIEVEAGRRAGDEGEERVARPGQGDCPSTILRSCWSEMRGE